MPLLQAGFALAAASAGAGAADAADGASALAPAEAVPGDTLVLFSSKHLNSSLLLGLRSWNPLKHFHVAWFPQIYQGKESPDKKK